MACDLYENKQHNIQAHTWCSTSNTSIILLYAWRIEKFITDEGKGPTSLFIVLSWDWMCQASSLQPSLSFTEPIHQNELFVMTFHPLPFLLPLSSVLEPEVFVYNFMYYLVTVIDSPSTHFLISCLHSYLFTFYLLVTPPTHFLIFRPRHFHPTPTFWSRSVCFSRYVAHISCLAMFCNHSSMMRIRGLGSKRLIWLLHLSSCDRLELFREHE